MTDVFVSYSQKDRERVAVLAHALEERGFDVWWDHELLPGQSYREKIGQELNEAKAIVVVWSKHSIESQFVFDEAGEGQKRRVLLPVTIDPVEPPLGFRQVQAEDLTQWPGPAGEPNFQRVVKALEQFRGAPSTPAPPVKPQKAAALAEADDGRRPLTRPTGTYASLVFGVLIGLVFGLLDFETPNPSSANVGQAIGLGGILGLVLFGPLLMLARWLVAAGDRAAGKQPMRYFDAGFLTVLAISGGLTIALLLAGTTETLESEQQSPLFAALSGFVVILLPLTALGYMLVRRLNTKTPPVVRPFALAPNRFERLAPWGLTAVAAASIAIFAATQPATEDAEVVSDAPSAPQNFSLDAKELAALEPEELIQRAVERTSIEQIRSGAESGDALGQSLLCFAYDSGQYGVPADEELAGTWCNRAAKSGSSLAKYALARARVFGIYGMAEDPASGAQEILAVATEGDARAQSFAGTGYLLGSSGFPQDDTEALKWLRLAAQAGHQNAQFNLAWMYENGRGAPQDYATALLWYQKLADEGSPIGIRAVGWMHLKGWGVEKDVPKAIEHLQRASDLGDGNATSILASLYELGEGDVIVKDMDEATRLYRLAESQGFAEAGEELKRLGLAD